jgi:hypothetical protein
LDPHNLVEEGNKRYNSWVQTKRKKKRRDLCEKEESKDQSQEEKRALASSLVRGRTEK